ncbi:recombinase RecT [Psychrobacter sp. UBA2514]|jgi:recombination protein RecT|uniref:recombinase RecT n=1 Tax=Psychrobacter sp. UBA2514 TaxID=1947346 RepID=UPI00257A2781|nr:recombinase RecT [Psychrobacter sp. UBA2514]|tara:strand:+ start:15716 stop:16576 length:861 start_codon:yes stop_codon:yes gene_type:complete
MSNAIAIKAYMNGQGVQRKLEELLGERKDVFLTSALQVVNSNKALQNASPESIFGAVVTAATLNLPINDNLGFAYIVPFKGQASFQMGYKGFVQLAQRSGQFKRISACKTYSGDTEQSVYERLTAFLPKEPKGEVTGYIAYFQLLNGFEAHLAMTNKEMASHAGQYSQSFKKGYGVWKDNFEAMAQKTVLKLLLSKQAPLSIVPTLAEAVQADQAIIRDVNGQQSYEYADNQPQQAAIEMDISDDPNIFATVKTSIENGNLDKRSVLDGSAGYTISNEQRQELLAS